MICTLAQAVCLGTGLDLQNFCGAPCRGNTQEFPIAQCQEAMSRMWGGDSASKGGSSTLAHTLGLEMIHFQAGRGPGLWTGTCHTQHGDNPGAHWAPVTPPEGESPSSVLGLRLFQPLTGALQTEPGEEPWHPVCSSAPSLGHMPVPSHHGLVLLLGHLPSCCPHTTEATAAACRQERLLRPQQTTRNVTGHSTERPQPAD